MPAKAVPFVKGVLGPRQDLASTAELLHDLCFDRVELDEPGLGYEPRWSDKCARCSALWVASKAGRVMRIDLRMPPSPATTSAGHPEQTWIPGNNEARAIYHLHGPSALGDDCLLLIGRDNGVLDLFSDPPQSDARPSPSLVASLHLQSWWEDAGGTEIVTEQGFVPRDPPAESQRYARGITAITAVQRPRQPDILDILVATRHPRLYVIEARGRRLRLHEPKSMPGWIEWIIRPPQGGEEDLLAHGPDGADHRITFISRSGDIVRLSSDELRSGTPARGRQLALLPTAAMPFDHRCLLLGTTTGLFGVRDNDQPVALPVTRSPVLCLDRVRLASGAPDEPAGDALARDGQLDYVTMGLEDGRLRVVDAKLLQHWLAPGEKYEPDAVPGRDYLGFSKEVGSAVLAVETLRPVDAPGDAAYVLAVLRDHSVRLFHATSRQAQRERFYTQWQRHVAAQDRDRRASSADLAVELAQAKKEAPDGCDPCAWSFALIDAVLPQLARRAKERAGADMRSVNELARELAARADRRGLHRLSMLMGTLCDDDVALLLELSRAVLSAAGSRRRGERDRLVETHLRDLNALAARCRSEVDLARLVAWTRFVRKYVLLGYTFASKRTRLRELVEQNYQSNKMLDALIYQTRLCRQQYDVRWSRELDEHTREEVAALHTVSPGGGPTLAVAITVDGRLAVFEASTGRRLPVVDGAATEQPGDRRRTDGLALAPFREHSSVRTLASTVVADGAGFRVVLSCRLTTRDVEGGGPRVARAHALAVIDVAASRGEPLRWTVTRVPCTDEVHAVRALPGRSDVFVVGLDTEAAPVGRFARTAMEWVLERVEDTGATDATEVPPARPVERSSLEPGKTPTRALAVALDDETGGCLVVAGSDDGLVRVLSLDSSACSGAAPWKLCRWERLNDAVTAVVLGPHEPAGSEGTRSSDSERTTKILFTCYLATASGDFFALSIGRGASSGVATNRVRFGPHDAQPLWREAFDGPVLAAEVWRTSLYRSDAPHRVGEQFAEILFVATEKGRLCIYNHAPSVAKGRIAMEVSATSNYRFRGMRLARISTAERLRALTLIEGSAEFLTAVPGGRLSLSRFAYLRGSVEREPGEPGTPGMLSPVSLDEPTGPLPETMAARLEHLFLRSLHDAAFHADRTRPYERDRRKLDLCELIRLEGGAMSRFVLHRRFLHHERWDRLPASRIERRARHYLDRLDPEAPEQAELIKVVLKSLCRQHLLHDPRNLRAELARTKARRAEVVATCEIAADYLTRKLAYATNAAARLRIATIKELLRVPVLYHIAQEPPVRPSRVRQALESALDSCLRDDNRLVRIETLRALWVMLRNVSVMAHRSTERVELIDALFPDGLGSVQWLLDRIVAGLLRFPSFTQGSALIGSAWYHIWVLLPLFRIFPGRALALCAHMLARGLDLEVVAMCARSLYGRDASSIRDRLEELYLLAWLDREISRGEYIARYKGLSADRQPPAPAHMAARRWHSIDDAELADELTRLLDQLARMWDVSEAEQLSALSSVAVAPESPFVPVSEAVRELAAIGRELATHEPTQGRALDRLAELGKRYGVSARGGSTLTGPLRRIISGIIDHWQRLCEPPPPRPDMDIGDGFKLGKQLGQGSVFELVAPDQYKGAAIKVFTKWNVPGAAARFRAGAASMQTLRAQARQDDARYVVEISTLLTRAPYFAYTMPLYPRSLADHLSEPSYDPRLWTERAAEQLGRALRAAHALRRYHGDVKPSNILVEMVTTAEGTKPVFRLDGFAPPCAPPEEPGPGGRLPEFLAQKYEGPELGRRQWEDVARLSWILYQLLTGQARRLGSTGLGEPAEQLDQLLDRPAREHRVVLNKIIKVLKSVFSGGIAAITIDEFLNEITPSRGRDVSNVDIGILTIRNDELEAVLRAFPQPVGDGWRTGTRRRYAVRYADIAQGGRYTVAIVRQPEQGTGEAQTVALDLIQDLAPRLVLVVGIAGSFPSDDVTLGDVVLGTRIHDYTVEARGFEQPASYAVTGGPIDTALAASVVMLSAHEDELRNWSAGLPEKPPVRWDGGRLEGPPEWLDRLRDKLQRHHGPGVPARGPRYMSGPIASSDRLVKDPEIVFAWLQTMRNLLAVEMESAGVFRACRDRCAMLPIRGISDIVGLKRDDQWTAYACDAAAAFARAYLRTRPI